jgi:NAD(P)H-nitrite reductase large subunit
MSKYVIVGGSAAGIGAVEAIREMDPVGSITVISEEQCPTYSRPLISDFVGGKASFQSMQCREEGFWKRKTVQLLAGTRVVSVNPDEQIIRLDNGQSVEYEKLLIATGGRPFIPKIDGLDKEGVFTFTTISDAERLTERIERIQGQKAVVVGAGLIGISVTEALVKRGLQVTVVELQSKILSLLLDAKASSIVEDTMRNAGVTIIAGQSVQRIVGRSDSEDTVGGVVLTKGESVPCDLVIIAIGVVPRTEIISGSQVKTNRGIIVDNFMQTNAPNIYASGDVAETFDFIANQNRVLPLWPLAVMEGKIAGYNMTGKKTSYMGGTNMSTLKYFGLPIVSIGIVNPEDETPFEILTKHDSKKNLYKKIVLKDNLIVGITLVNDIEKAGVFHYLMKNRVNVKKFKRELISDDFGLAMLPASLRNRICLGHL